MTTNELISEMTSANNNIARIESQFFNVVLEPARVSNPYFEQPIETYFVYNENSGKQISKKSVGKDFVPMQQKEFLANIIETVREFGADLDLRTLKFRRYCNDSKIEFSIKMKRGVSFVNERKINDITDIELIFSTSYDGTKCNRISFYTRRLVCLNGMTLRKLQGELKGRNTMGGKTKILSYAQEVAEMLSGINEWKEKIQKLNERKVTTAEIEDFKLKVFGYNKATLADKTERQTRKPLEILNNFELAMSIEIPRTGETAWGLLQSLTYYTNHIANENGKVNTNEEFVKFATGEKINDEAQKYIYAMVD